MLGPVALCMRQFVVRDVEWLHLVGSDHPHRAVLGAQDVDELQGHLLCPARDVHTVRSLRPCDTLFCTCLLEE